MSIPFLQAKYYTGVRVDRRIDFIVLHDMEMAEQPTTAEACARYFQNPSTPSSCHYCVDSDSEVQCVRENDIAYHAPPNTHSIGIEHAGFARQTRAQWLDPYGLPMLRRSATICRDLCNRHDVPRVFLSVADLRAGKRGITTHRNISLAFGQSTHTDPGENFPVDHYMALVKLNPVQEDEVTPQDIEDIADAVWKKVLILGETEETARTWLVYTNRKADQIKAQLDPVAFADAVAARLPVSGAGASKDEVKAAVAEVLREGTGG